MSNLPEKKEENHPVVSIQSALLDIVQRKDIDPERLKQFLDLQIEQEDRQARMAFMHAMAGFQGECPVIPKSKRVNFKSVDYRYSPIEEMTRLITPITKKWGLSYTFDIRKTDNPTENNLVTIISHEAGFSKEFNYYFENTHSDDRMNNSQKAKSAITYAKRAALENALGIVTGGEDTDAHEPVGDATVPQMAEIKTLIDEVKPDMSRFLKFLGAENIDSLTAAQAERAIHGLKQKRGQK